MSPNALDSLLQGATQGWLLALEFLLLSLSLLALAVLLLWLLELGLLLLVEERQQQRTKPLCQEPTLRPTAAQNILLWRAQ